MLIDEVTNSGAIPALELSMRFAAARHTLLAHNIANLDTPNFIPQDASVEGFQGALRDAIERRRARTGGEHGRLEFRGTREVAVAPDGRLSITPRPARGTVLFHDRNPRDLERTMADLAENVAAYRVSADLLRSRFELIRGAIAERV